MWATRLRTSRLMRPRSMPKQLRRMKYIEQFVSERKQALERIDKLLEGIEEDKGS